MRACGIHLRTISLETIKISIINVSLKITPTSPRDQWVNSSPPSAAYMHQWIGSALVQIMPFCLFGTKPLSKPMLGYWQLDPDNKLQWNFNQNTNLFSHKIASENIICQMVAILSRVRWVNEILTILLPSKSQGSGTPLYQRTSRSNSSSMLSLGCPSPAHGGHNICPHRAHTQLEQLRTLKLDHNNLVKLVVHFDVEEGMESTEEPKKSPTKVRLRFFSILNPVAIFDLEKDSISSILTMEILQDSISSILTMEILQSCTKRSLDGKIGMISWLMMPWLLIS